jgi:transcriptional regulator with XRE-family HTH domain
VSVNPFSELAALKRALGRQLATSRQAAEMGQQHVAHRTGYSRSSVAHAEAGRQLLTRDFWRTADQLVKADGVLLAEYERVRAVIQEHERRSRETQLVRAWAGDQRLHHENNDARYPASCPTTVPSADAVVKASQETWRAVRQHLIRHRTQLAKQAVKLYNPAWQLMQAPALAQPNWLPLRPIPIEAVTLEWVPHHPRPVITAMKLSSGRCCHFERPDTPFASTPA